MVVVVVLDVHLIQAVVNVCEVLMIVHLVRVGLVSGVNILLILLNPAIRCAHKLLLTHFNTSAIDLLKKSQEVTIVDDVIKGSSEKIDQSKELTWLNLLLTAVKDHVNEVTLLDHTGLVTASLLELGFEVELELLVQFTNASQN